MAGLLTISKRLSDTEKFVRELADAQKKYRVPSDEYLKQLILPLIPKPRDGRDAPSIESIIDALREKVRDDLKPVIYEILSNNWHGGGQANRNIQVNGVNVLTPFTDINLKAGSGVTISTVANQTTKYMEFTIASSSGGGYQQPTSGVVDGSNATFVFSTAPRVLCVDQGRVMQQTSSDTTVNWTGTTTVILTIAPTFDIFAIA